MSYFIVDIESDGPIPKDYSMLSFASVCIPEDLDLTKAETFFSGEMQTISPFWDISAIESIGLSLNDYTVNHVLSGMKPKLVMENFETWISQVNKKGRPIFVSDNNGFDWMFICWYFHHFLKRNPFGYSSRRIGDIYCGLEKNMRAKWKHLRKTKHTHNPIDDAMGNAEAFVHILKTIEGEPKHDRL